MMQQWHAELPRAHTAAAAMHEAVEETQQRMSHTVCGHSGAVLTSPAAPQQNVAAGYATHGN